MLAVSIWSIQTSTPHSPNQQQVSLARTQETASLTKSIADGAKLKLTWCFFPSDVLCCVVFSRDSADLSLSSSLWPTLLRLPTDNFTLLISSASELWQTLASNSSPVLAVSDVSSC